jgi:hypothetical protein
MGHQMTNEEFKAWVAGYVLLSDDAAVNEKQITIIKSHANLVKEIDGFLTEENQSVVDNISVGKCLANTLNINHTTPI